MFTGIIEELGSVERFDRRGDGGRLTIRCKKVLEDAREGSSIAVNGVCLTAVDLRPESFSADLAPETLRRTNLGTLAAGSRVNLERPLSVSDRLNGHIVQGHVDGVGEIVALQELGDRNWWLRVRVPQELDRYFVYKGSIAIDGISLTVAEARDRVVSVTVIPHTYEVTNLGLRKCGDSVNLECDVLAKYLERLLAKLDVQPALSVEKLKEQGY